MNDQAQDPKQDDEAHIILVRAGAWSVTLAAVSFLATIVFLGTHAPAFWRPHKAISDIGAHGPWSLYMNWFGFILPGLLVIPFSISLLWRASPPVFLGPLFLAAGGSTFAAAGVFSYPLPSHNVFAAATPLLLALGIWILSPAAAIWTGWKAMYWITRVTSLVVFANIGLPWLPIPFPGHYQKVSLLVAWSWLVTVGWSGVQAKWSDG